MTDLSFIAEAVSSVAIALAIVRVIPTIAASILISLDKITVEEVKDLFRPKERKKRF